MYRGFRGLTFFSRVGKSLYLLSTIEMYHKQQFVSHLSNFDTRKPCLSLKNTVSTYQICEVENWSAPSRSEWVANIIKMSQFQGQVFLQLMRTSLIDAITLNRQNVEIYTGLSSMSSASSPERGQCVPNTSQTVRSRWKRAFPSWSVRFAYTAWSRLRHRWHQLAYARTWERTPPNNGHHVMRSSNQREAFLIAPATTATPISP